MFRTHPIFVSWALRTFVRMKFLNSRWPLRILWLALYLSHAFYFVRKPPRTKYTKITCTRNILDLQYSECKTFLLRIFWNTGFPQFDPLRCFGSRVHQIFFWLCFFLDQRNLYALLKIIYYWVGLLLRSYCTYSSYAVNLFSQLQHLSRQKCVFSRKRLTVFWNLQHVGNIGQWKHNFWLVKC